jgi:hypothetical protein
LYITAVILFKYQLVLVSWEHKKNLDDLLPMA